jgi:hypothetical protein
VAIGGPWIAANCAIGSGPPTFLPRPALYSIAARTWTAVPLAPSIAATCATADACQIRGVGRHWLAIYEQLCNHCASPIVFQNLGTGEVKPDPTAATTLPDLDSPTLAAAVCRPLRLPRSTTLDAGETVPSLGSLTFAGRFALATSGAAAGPDTTYLQRCGSRLHTFVCHCSALTAGNFRAVVANARVVIWAPPTPIATPVSHLDGMYLPSRRRFVIPLPVAARARGIESLLLTSRTLYIANNGDTAHVFRAPSPR